MAAITLPPRLSVLAEMVGSCTLLADIGTDHALLPIYLLQSGQAQRALASDIAPGPLERARENLSAHALTDKVKLLLSDGLDAAASYRPDAIAIAGMGGETIRDILTASDYPRRRGVRLILQPNTRAELLREYLYKNGFCITCERAVRQGRHFYIVIAAHFAGTAKKLQNPTAAQCALGSLWPDHIPARDYLKHKAETCERILEEMRKSDRTPPQKHRQLCEIAAEARRRLQAAQEDNL